jgi:vancomycin resistance protein VanW
MSLRKFIPIGTRIHLKLFLRWCSDLFQGHDFALTNAHHETTFPPKASLMQTIMPGPFFDNKVHNFRVAIVSIHNIVVYPGQVFSFWKTVKRPTEHNGYKKGRNIVAGMVAEEYGGGLCQISSILYHLALLTGLEVVERHNHSVDIYEEYERFTPLGADATVVYGYKDLRIRNNHHEPLRFSFDINGDKLSCSLRTCANIPEHDVSFKRIKQDPFIMVDTSINGKVTVKSVYNLKV